MVVSTPEQRFWSKVDRSDGIDACWPWQASVDAYGYGKFAIRRGLLAKAHRYAYQRTVGPIPEGHDIDHTCHKPEACPGGITCPHRRCCNPAHMEPRTRSENTLRGAGPQAANARKTHCARRHPLSGENLYLWTGKNGRRHRDCLTCRRRRAREYQAARRAAAGMIDSGA